MLIYILFDYQKYKITWLRYLRYLYERTIKQKYSYLNDGSRSVPLKFIFPTVALDRRDILNINK